MTVTFHESKNLCLEKKETFAEPKSGIYIYGLKLEIENKRKFVPLYVGTAKNLRDRLWQHYCEEKLPSKKSEGKSLKELFDFSLDKFTLVEINKRYQSMKEYDEATIKNKKEKHEFNCLPKIENLIWFQNQFFLVKKFDLGSSVLKSSKYDCNHMKTIADYDKIFDLKKIENKKKVTLEKNIENIKKTKQKFNDGFYFVYATLDGCVTDHDSHILYKGNKDFKAPNSYNKGKKHLDGATFACGIEYVTKQVLNGIGVYTTAKANKKTDEQITIDLSAIRDILINLKGEFYTNESLKIVYEPEPKK